MSQPGTSRRTPRVALLTVPASQTVFWDAGTPVRRGRPRETREVDRSGLPDPSVAGLALQAAHRPAASRGADSAAQISSR